MDDEQIISGGDYEFGEVIPDDAPVVWADMDCNIAINVEGVPPDQVSAYAEKRLRTEIDELSRRLMLPRFTTH